MLAVALAASAGLAFGVLTIAVRWGLRQTSALEIGTLITTVLALVVSITVAVPTLATTGVHPRGLLPYAAAGLIAPGISQIAMTYAVREVGPSRTATVMAMAPLLSLLLAFTLLNEPFHSSLLSGAILIVAGGVWLTTERVRALDVRARGLALALGCALLFSMRDTLIRWTARSQHTQPLLAASVLLAAACMTTLLYLVVCHRSQLRPATAKSALAFVPAGVALGIAYIALLAALSHGRLSIVSPLSATGALWSVLLAGPILGPHEASGRRTLVAALLIVAGGVLIGATE